MASDTPASGFTDIDRQHWTLRHLPPWARPYGRLARWDRPIGTGCCCFPAGGRWRWPNRRPGHWGALAGWMALFAIGALAMRGAGCTWNDIVDRKVDAQVERTRGRPLPAGEIKLHHALGWLAIQLAIGAAILFKLNKFAGGVALLSLLLVAIYPTMKRLTSWPQFVLGLAFNWGALVGYATVTDTLTWPPVALYAGGVAWTLVYDTIYAMQDQRDDAIVGVRSTARRFANAPRRWLTLFVVLALVFWTLCGVLAHLRFPYFAVLLLIAAHFGWQLATLKPDDQADCLAKFKANAQVGWLLLLAILATPLIAAIR